MAQDNTEMQDQFQDVQLESPVEIIPSSKLPSKELPALPPRDRVASVETPVELDKVAQVKSQPPSLPPRDNVAHVPEPLEPLDPQELADSLLPPLPQRSPRHQRNGSRVSETHNHRQLELQKSLIFNTTSYFMIIANLQFIDQFKLFIKDQGLYQGDQKLVSLEDPHLVEDKSVDLDFWKVLLFNYEEIQYTLEPLMFQKIELEFYNLSNDKLRRALYLGLTNSVYIDDELFTSLEVDVSSEQDLALLRLDLPESVLVVVSKLATVNAKLPNQSIVEMAKTISTFPEFSSSDVFKVIVCLNFQFENLVGLLDSESSLKFYFQLSRALEDNCPRFLLLLTKMLQLDQVLTLLSQLLSGQAFWVSFFRSFADSQILVKWMDSLILKGFNVLIVTFVKLISRQEDQLIQIVLEHGVSELTKAVSNEKFFQPLSDQSFYGSKEFIHLYKYEQEYELLKSKTATYSKKSNDKLLKAKMAQIKLLKLKKNLTSKYTQILSNYQQLNEEKFTNETYIKTLTLKKTELMNANRNIKEEYNMKTKNIEILKINNQRNEEVDKLNENLTNEIRRINEEIELLKEKIGQLEGSKRKK